MVGFKKSRTQKSKFHETSFNNTHKLAKQKKTTVIPVLHSRPIHPSPQKERDVLLIFSRENNHYLFPGGRTCKLIRGAESKQLLSIIAMACSPALLSAAWTSDCLYNGACGTNEPKQVKQTLCYGLWIVVMDYEVLNLYCKGKPLY